MPRKKKQPKPETPNQWEELLRNYTRGTADMEQRLNRKNGWKDIVKMYLNQIPTPWPFIAKVTEPLIRTAILEKNGRLLNSKLRGKLVPREHGDIISAKINNALIEYQWDRADVGGSMLEKVAMADLNCRLFGAAFAWIYWDVEKECNEMKIIDNRDVLLDPRLDHIRSATDDNWVQIREWLTPDALKARGYDVPSLEKVDVNDQRSTTYDSIVKNIRGVDDATTDPESPVLEVVHQLTNKETITFLPRHKKVLKTKKNPKGKIQVAMLRYYPLPEDIYGESEVEPVMGLARAVNWFLSGFMEEGNKMMHPPVITSEAGVRRETIVHTPGAIWIANDPSMIREFQQGRGIIEAFNNVYPMLKNAFNTAMGSQSIGVSSQQGGSFQDKTATEVREQSQQQSSRDQYNQLYLGEFLKDVMMMWVTNNQTHLLDDATKATYVLRIVGQDQMKAFERMGLGEYDIPDENMDVMMQEAEAGASEQQLMQMKEEAQVPMYPVVTNPEANPEDYDVVPKLNSLNDDEAELYIEKSDLDKEALLDFIPDIKSMAAGSSIEKKEGRMMAYTLATQPQTQQLLQADGFRLKGKELLATIFTDNNFNDADSYFEELQEQPGAGMQGVNAPAGQPGLPVPQGMAPANGGMATQGPPQSPFNG